MCTHMYTLLQFFLSWPSSSSPSSTKSGSKEMNLPNPRLQIEKLCPFLNQFTFPCCVTCCALRVPPLIASIEVTVPTQLFYQNATANTNWPGLLRILSRTTVLEQWSLCVHWKNWDQTLVVLWKWISCWLLAERNTGQRWVVGRPRQTSTQPSMPVVQCPHCLISKDGQNC